MLAESGSMKFILLTKYSVRLIEAEDIEEAIKSEYDDNTGYDNILGIVVAEPDQCTYNKYL